jgi:excisionase family DNA binding protein
MDISQARGSTQTINESFASEWLTADDAAHRLKVRARTLLLWARQGKVRGYVLSGVHRRVWRFRKQDLDAAFLPPEGRDVLHLPPSSVRSAE